MARQLFVTRAPVTTGVTEWLERRAVNGIHLRMHGRFCGTPPASSRDRRCTYLHERGWRRISFPLGYGASFAVPVLEMVYRSEPPVFDRTPMSIKWRIVAIGSVTFAALGGNPPCRGYAQTVSPEAASAALLPRIEQHILRSRINGRAFDIFVALPNGYRRSAGSDTTRYPVLYLLDGRLELPLFAGILRQPGRRGRDGDLILVGIAYPPSSTPGQPPPGGDSLPFRERDYSPPLRQPQTEPLAGGAPMFLRVIKEEIIPLIERTYRTNGDRGIHGFSMGGLFTAYVLLQDPNVFTRYAITSPALWYDQRAIFEREEAFRRSRTSLPKRVFVGVGAAELPEIVADTWRLVHVLCEGIDQHKYTGLTITAEMFPDESHFSVVPFSRALNALYPPSGSNPEARRNACVGG